MEKFYIENANISLISQNIIVFEADPDIVIEKKTAQNFYREIEKRVSGKYSIIIHRKHKYQLLRLEVFQVINEQDRLVAVAIVAPQGVRKKMADMEAPLCNKPFSTFVDLDEAIAWIEGLH